MRRLIVFLLVAASMLELKAQDPHITMFYNAPNQLNPALTGVFNGNYRVSALYRSQWGEVLREENTSQFRTMVASADFRLPVNKNSLGIGLQLLNDKASASDYGTLRVGMSFAYSMSLDKWKKHRLSIGLQAAMIQRSFSPDGLRLGHQWNGSFYDSSIDIGNDAYFNTLNQNRTFFDASVGALYFYRSRDNRTSAYGGFSFQHLNEPNQALGVAEAKLPIRFSVHAGVEVPVADQFSVLPKFLFQSQGQNIETLFGADMRYIFDPRNPAGNSFHLGAMYRMVGGLNTDNSNSLNSESIAILTGITFNGIGIGAAYDINVSEFADATLTRGAFEISASYIGSWERRKSPITPCPTF
ncbi:MAG: PorP/SprF family type IX secretion system membrane protein [Chitinophagales bacterium]